MAGSPTCYPTSSWMRRCGRPKLAYSQVRRKAPSPNRLFRSIWYTSNVLASYSSWFVLAKSLDNDVSKEVMYTSNVRWSTAHSKHQRFSRWAFSISRSFGLILHCTHQPVKRALSLLSSFTTFASKGIQEGSRFR